MKKRLTIILIMLIGITVLMSSIGYKNKKEMERTLSRTLPPAAVRVATAVPDTWPQKVFAVGTVVAEQGVNVTAPLPGTVIGIDFNCFLKTRHRFLTLS